MKHNELQGHAARTMVTQDARWAADTLLSLRDSGASGWLYLATLGISSRVVYEGSLAAESSNPRVGVPGLAAALEREHRGTIARSRHAGKFLDDIRRPLPDLKKEMLAFYGTHQDEFLGNSVWFARCLESDIGICLGPAGEPLTSTITGHFRMGLESGIRVSEIQNDAFELGRAHGSALALLASMTGDHTPLTATLDFTSIGPITDRDWRAERYLRDRFDPSMDLAIKLILLMIEGELNATALMLSPVAHGHVESAFRARIVSLFHSLRGIDEILTQGPGYTSPATACVRDLLRDPALRRWLDEKPLRQIRNRCMHYEIRQPDLLLNEALPMFGIVEALSPSDSLDSLNVEALEATERLRKALRDWNR